MTLPDRGLAPERTVLARRRTALSIVAGCAIIARLNHDRLGPAVMVLLVPAVLLAAVTGRDPKLIRPSREVQMFVIAIGSVALAITELVVVVSTWPHH